MATTYQISSSDSGSAAAQKINDSVSNLNNAIGSGGGGGSADTVVGRNQDAVQRIYAAKKHVIESGSGTPGSDSIRNAANNFCIAHGSDFHADLQRWKNFLEFAEGVDGIQAILCTGDFAANLGLTSVERMTDELRAKANRVLPREHTGHSKRPLPTTLETTLHMDITRWSTQKNLLLLIKATFILDHLVNRLLWNHLTYLGSRT